MTALVFTAHPPHECDVGGAPPDLVSNVGTQATGAPRPGPRAPAQVGAPAAWASPGLARVSPRVRPGAQLESSGSWMFVAS